MIIKPEGRFQSVSLSGRKLFPFKHICSGTVSHLASIGRSLPSVEMTYFIKGEIILFALRLSRRGVSALKICIYKPQHVGQHKAPPLLADVVAGNASLMPAYGSLRIVVECGAPYTIMLKGYGLHSLLQAPTFPQQVDRRYHEQRQQRCGDHAADHRCGDALHDF